jgi:hypothetical protein
LKKKSLNQRLPGGLSQRRIPVGPSSFFFEMIGIQSPDAVPLALALAVLCCAALCCTK